MKCVGRSTTFHMLSSDTRHLLLVAFPAWGHTRPLCVLGGRLAAESQDVTITILMAPNWLEKARIEIAAQFPSCHEALARIRVISIFQSDPACVRVKDFVSRLGEFYPVAYRAIFRGQAIHCAMRGTTFDAFPPPRAVIIDFFGIMQLQQSRAISGIAVPVFAFVSCGAAAVIRLFAPKSLGGLGDFGAKTDAEALRTGKTSVEIGDQVFKHTDGTVIRVPGIPPMYDYEFFPQNLPWDTPMAPIVRAGHAMLMNCDGIFIGTCEAYEKESLSALDDWVSSTLHKPLYPVGPLLPPVYGVSSAALSVYPHVDMEIQSFLDDALAQHGEQSTILVSFGTLFWPTVPDHVNELVDALTEKKFPFILCHASPFSTISSALRHKIETSGVGMIAPWCPQQFILNHLATGWFMTHGGHGGIFEALSNGIPLICWPFDGDQPTAAAHLTHVVDVAFQVVEVRTGKGLQPLFNGQVPRGTREAVREEFRRTFDKCRSEVGEKKRRNARRLRNAFSEAWMEGGSARVAINEFLGRSVNG
ncbi:UDP-Glycosyltransferase/glycogen phosphorylase [Mycena epipterygia]|nr:UDP-Glycosyltransferase/glycogen phosphorylase [Mycena epipterygia]